MLTRMLTCAVLSPLINSCPIRFSTQEMQKTAEKQYELTKKSRRTAIQNGRPLDFGTSTPISIPSGARDAVPRMRSGSGTSRTTATSDSGDFDGRGQTPLTTSSSPSQPSTGSGSFFYSPKTSGHHIPHAPSASSMATISGSLVAGKSSANATIINPVSALSPIANRVREQDADAREKYMRRNRSGSSSTDNKSQTGSTFSSALAVYDEVPNDHSRSDTITPRRLRPSASAAQLRSTHDSPAPESRSRAGTNPSAKPAPSPVPQLTRSSSISNSLRSFIQVGPAGGTENYHGPPSQYAQFPEPPTAQEDSSTPTAARRKAFQLLSKQSHTVDHSSNHRRGMSATAVRGP